MTPVTAAATLLLAIVLVLTLVDSRPDRERTVAPPPAAIMLRLDGELSRVDPTTWQTSARGPGGIGILTIVAPDGLTAGSSELIIPFVWTSAGGSIGGCITNGVERRRRDRVAWNAHGASPAPAARSAATSGARY